MMNYDKRSEIVIDYPGDYDVQKVLLKVFDTKDGNLHFVITYNDKKYIIVNHKSVLKEMDTNNVDVWIVPNQKIAEMLEKLEYDGEVLNLEELA